MANEMRADRPFDGAHPALGSLLDALNRVIVGKPEVTERVVCALLAGGHVLVEDVPGVGKTLLARTLSRLVSLQFHRVQFTPDLLPSDLLGVSIWDPAREQFSFRPGPVFTHLLLADEINRTSPRTQSALLEVMEEGQITVDGRTYPLEPPFMVVATENPLDYEGTFPLPESQLDRFLFRVAIGYPDPVDEQALLRRTAQAGSVADIRPVVDRDTILALQNEVAAIRVADSVLAYLTVLLNATRHHPDIYLGASPRAGLAWMRAAQAWALMQGRSYVVPDDLKGLAGDVLGHRLLPRGGPMRTGHGSLIRQVVDTIIAETPVPVGERW